MHAAGCPAIHALMAGGHSIGDPRVLHGDMLSIAAAGVSVAYSIVLVTACGAVRV